MQVLKNAMVIIFVFAVAAILLGRDAAAQQAPCHMSAWLTSGHNAGGDDVSPGMVSSLHRDAFFHHNVQHEQVALLHAARLQNGGPQLIDLEDDGSAIYEYKGVEGNILVPGNMITCHNPPLPFSFLPLFLLESSFLL